MKYSQAERGRTFVIRLEDGDVLHEALEGFAAEQGINAASVIILGGADAGSKLVVGPAEARAETIVPMEQVLDDVAEVSGVGTIFPNGAGNPVLHMHIACGREADTVTGCVRRGVRVWHVMEVVLQELTSSSAVRRPDAATGFELLQP
jgi:predicted DNA-binding protein with PD1-like motif